MAHYYYISFIVIGILLFASCGQVGSITGGEQDHAAPKMLIEKVSPPLSSTNISPQKITIPFDEFIELNKPAENIRVAPADVKLDYAIKKKSLVLTVKEGEWSPNTTYTIYLNRAVRDINESNDSIMSYVFSTGSFIDSLQTAIQVRNAYTGEAAEGITVGLYTSILVDDTSKVDPRYYATTDKNGIATFQHIKDTEFYAYAFEDENRNNRLDATERRAGLTTPVELFVEDTIEVVGPVIRLMPAEAQELKVINNNVLPSANWGLSFNRSLNEDENFSPIESPKHIVWNKEMDSVTIYYETAKKSGEFTGTLNTPRKTDTISKKYFFRTAPILEVKNNLKDKKLGIQDTLKIRLNEPIKEVDTNLIQLYQIPFEDSLRSDLPYQVIPISIKEFGLLFEKAKQEKIFLEIAPEGLIGINSSLKDSVKLEFGLQEKRETGTLIVEFDSLPPYGILYITNKTTKEEIQVVFDGIEKTNHTIEYLSPGQYDFRYLIDEDKNGKWSTGSIFTEKEAEKVIWLPDMSTIRANWDVKTTLNLNPQKNINDKNKGLKKF